MRAVDRAGNVDPSPARRACTVDATAPETTIASGPPPATRSTTATIAFSSPDSEATFRCRLDAGERGPGASPHELAALAEGDHVLERRGGGPCRQRRPDCGRPPLEGRHNTAQDHDHVGARRPTKYTSASFGFSSNEGGTTFKCRRDVGAWSSCPSPKRYSSLAEGAHTFESGVRTPPATSRDAPPQHSWKIDLTPPSVSLSAPSSGSTYTRDRTVAVSASADDANGVSKVDFYDNGSLVRSDTTSPFGLSWTVNSRRAGAHRWTAKAYDAAGNSTSSAESKVDVNIVAASRETDPVPHDATLRTTRRFGSIAATRAAARSSPATSSAASPSTTSPGASFTSTPTAGRTTSTSATTSRSVTSASTWW